MKTAKDEDGWEESFLKAERIAYSSVIRTLDTLGD